MNKVFLKKEAIKHGWKLTKKNIYFILKLGVFLAIIYITFSAIEKFLSIVEAPISLPFWILTTVFEMFLAIGILRIFMSINDGKEFKFSDLWNTDNKTIINYFIGSIYYCLIVIGGMILLVVPGIYWAIKYSFTWYLIIDKNLSPKEALKMSGEITSGSKWNIFFFMILIILVNILGVIVFGVGLLWSMPTTILALIFVYRKLLENYESKDKSIN